MVNMINMIILESGAEDEKQTNKNCTTALICPNTTCQPPYQVSPFKDVKQFLQSTIFHVPSPAYHQHTVPSGTSTRVAPCSGKSSRSETITHVTICMISIFMIAKIILSGGITCYFSGRKLRENYFMLAKT